MRVRVDRVAARLIAGYGAAAFVLPYLALKAAWLGGNPIGFRDERLLGTPGMIAANAASFGMDLVALGLALTFAHGLRVPAWLVLFPMWVATGFLTPALVIVPVAAVTRALAGAPAASPPSMLEPWVGRLVGASFAGQAVGLLAAFVLYARARWADLWEPAVGAVSAGPPPVQARAADLAALIALGAGGLHLAWAFGASVGLGAADLAGRSARWYALHAIWGSMSIAGAAGIAAMAHQGRGRVPFLLALGLTWVGAGSMFAWGAWNLVLPLAGITGRRGVDMFSVPSGLNLVKCMAGALMGLLAAQAVRCRRRARMPAAPTTTEPARESASGSRPQISQSSAPAKTTEA